MGIAVIPGSLRRLARWHGLARSPLRRISDRVEGILMTMLAMLALAVLPLAVVVATWVYQRELADGAAAAAQRSVVTAVLVADPVEVQPPMGQGGVRAEAIAPVGWQLPNGRSGGDELLVTSDLRAGDRLSLWVDREGHRTDPPKTRDYAVTAGLVTGIDLVIVGWLLLAGLGWTAGRVLDRINAAWWDTQWATEGARDARR